MKIFSKPIIMAIMVFILFGWLTVIIGTFDWLDILKVGLLGVSAFFSVFNYITKKKKNEFNFIHRVFMIENKT